MDVNIKENLEVVEKKIMEACKRSGRNREDVTLIAVSKTKPVEMIRECMDAGITVFGENKAQELRDKQAVITEPLNWNFIGHLQRNKVKYVVGNVDLIHSVDSFKLADAINVESIKKGVISNILIEVNVANEESKFGIAAEEVMDLINDISKLSNIKIKGLMTIAPYVDDPEENRIHFINLRKLLVDIRHKNIDNVDMNVLSMGMTGDYEVAIEEGATMVRVGTGIFGSRYYI